MNRISRRDEHRACASTITDKITISWTPCPYFTFPAEIRIRSCPTNRCSPISRITLGISIPMRRSEYRTIPVWKQNHVASRRRAPSLFYPSHWSLYATDESSAGYSLSVSMISIVSIYGAMSHGNGKSVRLNNRTAIDCFARFSSSCDYSILFFNDGLCSLLIVLLELDSFACQVQKAREHLAYLVAT